jgi:hypothetical protein
MALFRRRSKPEHDAGPIYVLDKRGGYPPYYSAVCRCGWYAEPVDAPFPNSVVEQQMATASRAHYPDADLTLVFPLDRPGQR